MTDKTESDIANANNATKHRPIPKMKEINTESPENFEKWRTTVFANALGV